MNEHVCKNCGKQFQGKFCNYCGEKIYTDHDKTMGHFFHEVFHFFSHFDNKFFKTVRLIFRSPAELSVAYTSGARSRYYNPFSLFFVGVILYLLFPLFQGLNMSFSGNIINLEAQNLHVIANLARHKAAAKHISMNELALLYDHKSPAFAKVLLLVILPLTGLVLKALFSKKRKYFFDYLVLATEASCIMLYLNFFILPIILYCFATVSNMFHITSINAFGDAVTIPASALYTIYWTTKGFHLFFGISYKRAFAKGLLFLLFQSVVIYIIYRLILFLTVLLFI